MLAKENINKANSEYRKIIFQYRVFPFIVSLFIFISHLDDPMNLSFLPLIIFVNSLIFSLKKHLGIV